MKKAIIPLTVLVSALILFVFIKSRVESKRKNDKLNETYQEVLSDHNESIRLLQDGRHMAAFEKANSINSHLLAPDEPNHIDLQIDIDLLKKDILKIESTQFLKESFYDLTSSQYEKLKEHDFSWLPNYMYNKVSDSIFKEKMFDSLSNYSSYIDAIEGEKKIRALRKKESESNSRKIYAAELRNAFLDAGLNIKVSVSGKNNTILKLNYSLIDEVFTHKFSKEGRISEWHNMGFERVYFSNGYDYSVYYEK